MASVTPYKKQWRAFIRRQGHQRSKIFPTKSQAQKWAREQEHQIDNVARVPAGLRLTFVDLLDTYEQHVLKMGRSKRRTLKSLRTTLGSRRLKELTTQVFLDFIRTRSAEGAGPATVSMDLTYVHTILKHGGAFANAQEAVLGPMAALAAARLTARHAGQLRAAEERDRRPTENELQRLYDHWSRRRRGFAPFIPLWEITTFAIATAMRLSEITRLTWRDIDEDQRTVMIRDRKHPSEKKGNDQVVPLLEGHTRLFGEPLSAWKIVLKQKEYLKARKEFNPSGRVFPYSPHSISTMFTRAVKECGVDDLHFHDLRHEGVSRLFEAGYTIEQVALVSGHKDWKQLKRYTNIKASSLHRN